METRDDALRTPLSYAASTDNVTVVKILIGRGATLDSRDRHGRTPLSWAAAEAGENIVKLLISNCIDCIELIEQRDDNGRSPLSWAASSANYRVVLFLLSAGADIDSVDSLGRSPLSWAAGEGSPRTVKVLLEHGANVDTYDHEGRSPMTWAADNKRADLGLIMVRLAQASNGERDDQPSRPTVGVGTYIGAGAYTSHPRFRSGISDTDVSKAKQIQTPLPTAKMP
ncbi:ankyrin repeat-containing domain protein [Echria macrotheca]|uniref:Ankyrin repeat-containing domain protein n=1 Tax=Echria macrotheca TaxID=438768 RepID=A0AAJ0F4D0_9PEZI|nr:ankyrin repeat-containing domain protein [Echria macrotheca]